MTNAKQISRYTDDGCTIIWDRRYLPSLIGHIRGKATMAAIDFYFEERNATLLAAEKAGEKVVVLNDMTEWIIPPATVRKALGDRAKNDVNIKSIVRYVNVVPNALLRGVITAISWITGDEGLQPVQITATFDEAIRIATGALREAGVSQVPRVDNYSVPDA